MAHEVEGSPVVACVASATILRRATRYAINLDKDVDRDKSVAPISAGHALVYQGTLRPSGKRIAIKIVKGATTHKLTTPQLTLREAHVWSKLRHENVLRLLGIVTKFDGTIALVTEWMPQGNAHDYVQDKSVDPRPVLSDIACGLYYLHNHHIIHGDLKGANVLISNEGRALLTDFGLSLLVNSSFSMTTEPPRGGSWRWLSPENIDSQEYNITCPGDIWAFGMTVLELFTRENPYPNIHTIRGLMLQILRGPPERPKDELTCFLMDDEWWRICCMCWQQEPLSRPNMSQVVAIIERLGVRHRVH
ncbi:hypothetical protein ID866_12153 [Astraeus odoratus]|nr:hypothetical protein ID866_12153 [Astraeus odoratus]